MPISHKYKAIFVHIPKTGGTSVERLLAIPENKSGLFNCNPNRGPIYQHLVPSELKKYIPENQWKTYFKFTSVRHPLQRAISDYKFFKINKEVRNRYKIQLKSFSDYCKLAERVVKEGAFKETPFFDHFIPQHYYFEGINYDKICKTETLDADMVKVKTAIGCNKPFKRHHVSAKQCVHVSPEDIEIIERVYAQDYEQFGYKK